MPQRAAMIASMIAARMGATGVAMVGVGAMIVATGAAMAERDARAGMIRSWMATGMAPGRLARGIPRGRQMMSRWSLTRRAAEVEEAIADAARSQPCATPAAP